MEASESKLKGIEEEREALKKELEDVLAGLTELREKEEARIAQDKFNERMASFDEEFKLTDEDREVIAKDVADMDDETFAGYGEKMKVLLKDKNKKMLDEKKKEEDAKAAEAEASEEIVASESEEETSEEVVDDAIDNAEVEDSAVAATTDAQEATVFEKYKNAFSIDNFDLNK